MKVILYMFLILAICFYPGMAQNMNESPKPERVFLHTDRNIYLAGDNLSYSIYLQGNPGMLSKYAYLVVRDRYNQPLTQVRVDIRNNLSFGNIYLPDTLHTDIYQVVCYTNYMRNEGENSYFTKEIVIANRFDNKLDTVASKDYTNPSTLLPVQHPGIETGNGNLIIHLDKKVFNTREKVKFSIETNGIPVDSVDRLSVSVGEIVPGIFDEPSISDYFNKVNKLSVTLKSGQDHPNYYREIKGSVIEGRVLFRPKSVGQSVTGKTGNENETDNYTILISTPDSIANMQYTTTGSSGSFKFLLNPYYEGKELIIRLKENANAVIELDDKFNLLHPYVPSDLLNERGIRSNIIRSLKIAEVQRYYTERAELINSAKIEHSGKIPRVYYKPYIKVFPVDYLPLPDFVEISRELLPALKIRKSNDNYILSFIDTRNKGFLNIEPIIYLDGVPINDVNQIINLGTDQIDHIDMLPVIRYYGEMSLSGILAVFTNNLEINNIQFKTPTIRYQAMSSQNFTKPKRYMPVNINNHIPDVRQVLLWDPDIIMKNKERLQIECYTSDLHGDYRITIHGITSNGLPLFGSAVFTVKSRQTE